jgi:hypothetical protein
MPLIRLTCGHGFCVLVLSALMATLPVSALAQESIPDSDVVTVAGGIDLSNQYMFRGVRQNSTGVVAWPQLAVAVRLLSNKGPVERLAINFGFWNSLNTGDTGSGGPTARAWYESRLSGGLDFHFSKGVSVATSYTTHMSPTDLFTTAKELGIKVAMDDRHWLHRAAVHPYAFVAFEIDAQPGVGQLDGGLHAGRYLEVGATPGYSVRRALVAIPIRIGLSLDDYYELGNKDTRFGFASVGGFVSVPLGGASKLGQWYVRGGIDVYRLGETTEVFNGGDRFQTTASVGVAIRP